MIGSPAAVATTGIKRLSLGDALGLIRVGKLDRAISEADPQGVLSVLLSAATGMRVEPGRALAELRGAARTQGLPADADPSDLEPARAIRRALADGQMHAREVDYVAVEAAGPGATERAAHAVTLGLGRYVAGALVAFTESATGSSVIAIALGGPAQTVLDQDDPAIARLVRQVRGRLGERVVRGAVALSIRRDGRNLALAFSRPQ
jgi:hypothetical protein